MKLGRLYELTKGFIAENPTFCLELGLCPTLAVSTSLENSIGMGLAATFVLVFSNMFIAAIRKFVRDEVRMPIYIVVIATFVTIVSLLMKAYFPDLNRALGIYVPLIVVNCIIFARAEAYAGKNNVINSVLDGIGMGLGFTLALSLIGIIRELLGTAAISFGGKQLFHLGFQPALVMILSPGALFTMGLLLGFFAWRRQKKYTQLGCCGACDSPEENKEPK